jgi:hypothetical protein
MLTQAAELRREGARDRRKQVDVDEGANDGEEDLLHEEAGEHARERGAGDDRDEHEKRHDRAQVRGQERVERSADRVGSQDGREPHVGMRVRGPQDEEPRQRGKARLHRLEGDRGDQVPRGDRAERVPQAGDPTGHVDAQRLEQGEHESRSDDPGGDLGQPAQPRVVADRVDRLRDGRRERGFR